MNTRCENSDERHFDYSLSEGEMAFTFISICLLECFLQGHSKSNHLLCKRRISFDRWRKSRKEPNVNVSVSDLLFSCLYRGCSIPAAEAAEPLRDRARFQRDTGAGGSFLWLKLLFSEFQLFCQ